MAEPGLRVLVVDDEPAIRRFLRTTLSANGYTVFEAATGQAALAEVVTSRPDLIILDLGLPDMDGHSVTRQLREWTKLPIIILSVRGQEADKISALDAGADDYLTKPFVLAELLARVRALVRRGFHKGNARLHYADLELDRHRRRAMRGKEIIPLTSKEFALLELFLLHAPDLITRSAIVEHVWDYHFDSETNLVEVYINRLRQKIDVNGAPKLIHTVRGVGYRLGMPE